MGITRDSLHKRNKTGGRKGKWRKKRKYLLGRPSANTKLSAKVAVRRVRVRGGNFKFRALRLDSGNYSWGSEAITKKARLVAVSYHPTSNDLVRTQTLTKNAIVQVDAYPFKQWYLQHYGVELGVKKTGSKSSEYEVLPDFDNLKASSHVKRKLRARLAARKLDPKVAEQFQTGRLYACVSSRPGQMGRADGYILEGKELEFYLRKLHIKKKGAKAAA
eukprot:evm.model.scf_2594.1 EVM.evm.TU.scf_2594.1   scf_2594:1282-4746(+)